MLSLVPFDIDTIDSGMGARSSGFPADAATARAGIEDATAAPVAGSTAVLAAGEAGGEGGGGRQADLVGTILALGMKHLGDAGPTRSV